MYNKINTCVYNERCSSVFSHTHSSNSIRTPQTPIPSVEHSTSSSTPCVGVRISDFPLNFREFHRESVIGPNGLARARRAPCCHPTRDLSSWLFHKIIYGSSIASAAMACVHFSTSCRRFASIFRRSRSSLSLVLDQHSAVKRISVL